MNNSLEVMGAITTKAPKEIIDGINAWVNEDLIKTNDYDKFGDGDYITIETVTRLMNEIFGYVWSWEILHFYDKGEYVVCHGRLTIPGIGIRDGIGQQKAQGGNKDNSTMYSVAASLAFKAAAKRIGIAPNLFDKKDYDLSVFEPGRGPETETRFTEPPKGVADPIPMPEPATKMYVDKSTPPPVKKETEIKSEKKEPVTVKEMIDELKKVYSISTKEQFTAFAQLWDPQINDFSDLKPADVEALHAYVENNSAQFEEFVASDY